MTAAELERARVTPGGVVASEWLKLVTVRSTFWTTAVALLLAALVALMVGAFADPPDAGAGTRLALTAASVTLGLDALVLGVLGVLSIGGEYATLQIRSSFTAVPARWPVLVGKAFVVAAWSFVAGLVVTFGGFGIVAGLLAAKGVPIGLDGPTAGSLLGGAAYLAIVGAFGVGLGSLLRASAAGITVLAAILLVLPSILTIAGGLTRTEWLSDAARSVLSSAGQVLFAAPGTAESPLWAAVVALAVWLAAVWVPAVLVTRARDA